MAEEAIERALQEGAEAVAAAADIRECPVSAPVDAYLSTRHRDELVSCAVTTLAANAARGNDRVRSAYTRQVRMYLELLTVLIAGDDQRTRRAKAIAVLSTLVGAVSIARAVNDDNLSQGDLRAAADDLKAQLE